MNQKIVKKILLKKHKDFIESIKDEEVKQILDTKTIITGGAIASMLMNERVSDFDYYLMDIDSVEKVANYFVGEFIGLNAHKSGFITPEVIREKSRVKIAIKSSGIASETARDEDYQYFETTDNSETESYVESVVGNADDLPFDEAKKVVDGEPDANKPRYRPVFLSANAITLANKIQIIIRFYGDHEEIHKNFDYVHCTNYYLPNKHELHLNEPAVTSLLTKQLYYVGSRYPLCSIFRMRKYLKRGFYINAGQILKMAFQVSKLDLSNINVLEDQLTGVDAAYFIEIINAIKERQEKDPEFKIDSTYIATIVDKLWG